jgi:isopenicillin-N epimerase
VTPPYSKHADPFCLDRDVVFLNHGSFGACPLPVLAEQSALRARMEAEPVRFFAADLEGLLDEARAGLAGLLGADADDLAFVPNATCGINTVLRALPLRPGDELLVTDQEYNASRNALCFAAERAGAQVVVVPLPFPLSGPQEVIDRVCAKATARTRLLLIDHVTSQTGLVLPIAELVRAMAARGVDTLVDGAHAPGMLPLALDELGAAYYTGNCHKWLCAPKGAAFLHVRRDRQAGLSPLSISHGRNSPRTDRSRFRLEFDWTGTCDPTPWLCVPAAIRFLAGLLPGGLPALQAHNRALCLWARERLCDTLGVPAPCPPQMIGSLASLPLPDGVLPGGAPGEAPRSPLYQDPLQDALVMKHRVQVPVIPWPEPPRRLLRISAQIYNSEAQYEHLAQALKSLLG